MIRTHKFDNATVLWSEEGKWLVTEFDDGLSVPAAPNYDAHSQNISHELGYMGDTWKMSRDHEIAHTFLAEAQGKKYSPVMRALAEKKHTPTFEHDFEEMTVLAFQHYVNTGAWHPIFDTFAGMGILESTDELAKQFREIIHAQD